jgi:hypothetical protein
MTKKASSIADVIAAFPLVQAAVRDDIATRIAAGEAVARADADTIIAHEASSRSLGARRKDLLEHHRAEQGKPFIEHKSVA